MSSGGGSSAPTSTTVTQSNIPDWLRPQVETVLGGATQQLFNTTPNATGGYDITGTKPFVPYSANPQDYVAGFSPLQQQVQYNAANLQVPGQYNQATQLAGMAGQGALDTAAQGAGYGQAGFQAGQMGQDIGAQAAQQAAQNAAMAQNAAYGYGAQGQQSGLLGQQIGTQGGQYYGGMGAGYGSQAANLAPFAQRYGAAGYGYGQQAAQLANTALGYGQDASAFGQMALDSQQTGRTITDLSKDYAAKQAAAGQNYATQAINPAAYQQYMNPYTQNVTNVQNQELQRQADIAKTQRGASAARAGAFGGARQAIENAEAQRNLSTLMNQNQATGLQQAYNQAQQNMQYGSNLGLQGLSGAQSGLGTALQGGQLGLAGLGTALQGQQGALAGVGQAGAMYGLGMQGSQSGLAGLNAANQAYQSGMQGAGMGLQGVNAQLAGTAQGMQGAQAGLQGVGQAINAGQYGLQGAQTGMQGTAQGMQGAGMGLQGVGAQQAGYGLANQAAGTLGTLGNAQLAAQTGILGLQNQVGAQQQAQEQQVINNAINNFAQAQQQPMQDLNAFNALVRGYAVPGQTATQYQAAPSAVSQIAGLGTSALAANKLMGASGGLPKDFKRSTKRDGLHTLAMYNTMRRAA